MANTKFSLGALTLLSLGALALARMAYVLPADIESYTGPIDQSFTCENRPYGYYADVANFCMLFHICVPIPDNDGNLKETAHFTLACGNQTIFDQMTLTCNHIGDAFPCDQAPSLYDTRNSLFGREDEEF